MESELLLFDIDQLRIKYRGQKFDIEKGNPYIEESIELINQFKKEVCKKQREICAEKAELDADYLPTKGIQYFVKRDSIINALEPD